MIILFRLFLVGLIIYLLFRAFSQFGNQGNGSGKRDAAHDKSSGSIKKISKETGEYIDYEEMKK